MRKKLFVASSILFLTATSLFARLNEKAVSAFVYDSIVPAYRSGDSQQLIGALAGGVAQAKSEELNAVNLILREENIPPVAELLLSLRMQANPNDRSMASPSPAEILLLIPEAEFQIDSGFKQIKFSDDQQLPTDMSGFEKRFWGLHVKENQLAGIQKLLNAGKILSAQASKINARHLNPAERRIVATDFERNDELASILNRIQIARARLRLARIDFSEGVLQFNESLAERLAAAQAIDVDGPLLIHAIENPPVGGFDHPLLDDPGARDEIREHVERVRGLAGDLVMKARLFYEGLHWWKRGRYGMGTDGNGFLKPMNALANPQEMFALHMPIEDPKPTNPHMPSYDGDVPEIDRRHHYVWRYEYRNVNYHPLQYSQTKTKTKRTREKITLTRFY